MNERLIQSAYRLGVRNRSEGRSEMPSTVPADLAWAWNAEWYGVPCQELNRCEDFESMSTERPTAATVRTAA